MKYKCLVLDHDDTVVQSTREIHYPAFVETLSVLRPGNELTFDKFVEYVFSPGFAEMCDVIFHFDEQEMKTELEIWQKYVLRTIPHAYERIGDIIRRQRDEGGLICVVSHSFADNIRRDYKANFDFVPDEIYGWEYPKEQRKPDPFPLNDIMRKHGLKKEDLVMIDDLKPGYDMAKKAGVDFIGALWPRFSKQIENFMRENCEVCCDSVDKLEDLLFPENS